MQHMMQPDSIQFVNNLGKNDATVLTICTSNNNLREHLFMTSIRRGRVRLGWTYKDGGLAACARPHRNLKPTDVILSSSHAKKLRILGQVFCQYKLVI